MRAKYLANERGYPLHSAGLLALFGLKPSSPIPPLYRAIKTIQGIQVCIIAQPNPGRRRHRVFARCPICSQDIPAGRLNQHAGKKTCLAAAE